MKKKFKIAICFYGQVRFIEIFNMFYNKLNDNLDEFEFDFFISTWNDFDFTKINLDFKKTYLGNEKIVTENWKQGNTQKMSYLVYKVGQIKKDFEIENNFNYDFTVLVRPDIHFQKDDFLNHLNRIKLRTFDRPAVYTVSQISVIDNFYRIDEDWMFLFTPEAFDIHYNFYSFFYLSQKWRKLPIKYREGGHWIHAYFFKYNNFIVEYFRLSTTLIRPKYELDFYKKHVGEFKFFTKLKNFRKENEYNVNSPDYKTKVIC
tara:strand:+ start:570 stop:1349 length:780 start_codon:yes stop_codon:yes gene_type:complete